MDRKVAFLKETQEKVKTFQRIALKWKGISVYKPGQSKYGTDLSM